MPYVIEKEFFESLAKDIVELANLCQDSDKPQYSFVDVEIACVLADYNDGVGIRMISRAMLRNPKEQVYDVIADVLGSPKEALETLLKRFKDKTKHTYDLRIKSQNNSKPN